MNVNETTLFADAPVCQLGGLAIARVSSTRVLDEVFAASARGRGGWVVTANLDFLERCARDPDTRALYQAADVRVADGMPLVWASRVLGEPLPERIAGSTLTLALAERAAREGRTLSFLGGDGDAAERAVRVLREKWPALRVLDVTNPRVASPPSDDDVNAIAEGLRVRAPDILLVGLGSPKQEQLIQHLRARLPQTWMMGVGITFSFIAGDRARAPAWMQRLGMEWMHRLAQEPGRLAGRYLLRDLPFVATLFRDAWRSRGRHA